LGSWEVGKLGSMNLIVHQIAKDLRAVRWPLALWLAVLLGDGLVLALQLDRFIVGSEAANRFSVLLKTVGYVELVFGWLIAVRIIHADPLDTTTAFWLTRPLSPGALLIGKLTSICVIFLLLPTAVATAVAAANGVAGVTLLHFAAEGLTVEVALLLPIAVMAAITRDLPRFALGLVVAAVVYAVVHFTAMLPFSWVVRLSSQRAGLVVVSGWLAAIGASVVGSLWLLVHQYVTRQTTRTMAIGAVAVIAVVGVGDFWPWSFWSPTYFQPGGVNPRVFDAAPVALEFDPASLRSGDASQGEVEVRGSYRAEGLPVGWVAHIRQGRGTLRFATAPDVAVPTGEVFTPYLGSDVRRSHVGDVVRAFEHALGTRIIDAGPDDGRADARLLRLAGSTYQRFLGVPAEFAGTVTMLARRAEAGPAIPLRAGASGTLDSVRITVVSVDGSAIEVRDSRPSLFFPWGEPEIHLALRNRRRGEAVLLSRHVSSLTRFGFSTAGLVVTRATTEAVNADAGRTLADARWMADAELVMLSLEPVGTFEKRVRIDGFVLPQMDYYRDRD
jgi:hypothetical protein